MTWNKNNKTYDKTGKYVLLTNFSEDRLEIYKKAISKYKGTYKLKILEASNKFLPHGLYYKKGSNNPNGLSDFWKIYDRLKNK